MTAAPLPRARTGQDAAPPALELRVLAPSADPESARRALLHAVEALRPLPGRWTRVEVPVMAAEPLAWLATRRAGGRRFWADRRGEAEVAAQGRAATWTGGPRAVASAARALIGAGPRWRALARLDFSLGVGSVVLPSLEVGRDGAGAWMAAHVCGDRLPVELLEAAWRPRAGRARAPLGLRHDPDPAGWDRAVCAALADIAGGTLDKVVLARRTAFALAGEADPIALLGGLTRREPRSYRFLVEEEGAAFLGASPERLLRRRGRAVVSEALAGTRRRGADPAADAALGAELLASGKDRFEQRLVLDAVARALEDLGGATLTKEAPSLLRLAHVQHLHSVVAARLPGDVDDASLIAALHPTPAVCGAPRSAAWRRLAALEPRPRGAYAGLVGAVGDDAVELAVALRCATVRGREVAAWTGAGIVAGSEPAREWDELDAKLRGWRELLAGEGA